MERKILISILSASLTMLLIGCQSNGNYMVLTSVPLTNFPTPIYSEAIPLLMLVTITPRIPETQNTNIPAIPSLPQGMFTPTTNPKSDIAWITYSNTSEVSEIAFDSKNNLWTYGNGGLESWNIKNGTYKKYKIPDALKEGSNNSIIEIIEGPDGWMWFATNIGVARFDGEQWLFLTQKDGLTDDLVNTLAKGPNGEIWIGTQSGISRWKDGKLTSFTNPDQSMGNIQSIAVDNQGKV